jgi:hypothetical protein
MCRTMHAVEFTCYCEWYGRQHSSCEVESTKMLYNPECRMFVPSDSSRFVYISTFLFLVYTIA